MRRRILLVLLVAGIASVLVADSSTAADPVEAYVERLYLTVLQRIPDAPGLQHNVDFTRAQGGVRDITKAFFMCPEFLGGWGADDNFFVEALYLVVLNRFPDPPGLAHNANLVSTGAVPREQMIDAFLDCPEFLSQDPFTQGTPVIAGIFGNYDVIATINRDDLGRYALPYTWGYAISFPGSIDPLTFLSMEYSSPGDGVAVWAYFVATSPTTFKLYGVTDGPGYHGILMGEGVVYPDRSYSINWTWEFRFADNPNLYYTTGSEHATPTGGGTPVLTVLSAAWSTNPIINPTPPVSALTLTLDVPGAGAPAVGQAFNASVSITDVAQPSGWGMGVGLLPGATVTSNTINNAATAGPGGVVTFSLNLIGVPTVNGVAILGPPAPPPTVPNAIAAFLGLGFAGDIASICLNVDADAGVTTGGVSYAAQPVGTYCVNLQYP